MSWYETYSLDPDPHVSYWSLSWLVIHGLVILTLYAWVACFHCFFLFSLLRFQLSIFLRLLFILSFSWSQSLLLMSGAWCTRRKEGKGELRMGGGRWGWTNLTISLDTKCFFKPCLIFTKTLQGGLYKLTYYPENTCRNCVQEECDIVNF